MRIGELAKATGVAPRMLRYYEEQGLIAPRRLDNGYRVYDDYLIDRVQKIRGLIDAGIPTRIVADILPCLGKPQTIVVENADPALQAVLVEERDRMDEKIRFLTHNRDAITSYLQALERAAPATSGRDERPRHDKPAEPPGGQVEEVDRHANGRV